MISKRSLALAAFMLFAFAPIANATNCTGGHAGDCPSGTACSVFAVGQPGTCVTSYPVTSGTPAVSNGANTSGVPAQTNDPAATPGGESVTLLNPLGSGTTLTTLLQQILQFVVQIGSMVVILMLVYIGFLFVTAQGNESKLSEAKTALLWTVVGALILIGAEAIAQGIQATVSALSTGT